MPKFEVTNPLGYWDGAKKHPIGTKIWLDPEDYERLLSVDMKPLDPQAKRDLEAFRKKCSVQRRAVRDVEGKLVLKGGQPVMEDVPIEIPSWMQQKAGTLNPNNPKDLEKLTPRGARVIEEKPKEPEEEVVRPETSGM